MSDRPGEYQTNQPFEYVVGGSLPLDAVSYVKRSADDEFFAELKAGKFCYVLNSRQMGKSSLRVRTMARLQADEVVCVSIDMTAIGSAEVTAEQWYLGVLWAIVKQVREQTTALADWKLPVLRAWWVEREGLSFVQRWGEFIEVLLGEVGERVVIFVDEIDSVLGLGFRADDFFAAIRECYNRRVDQPQYDRLTFALLGVCAPQDLIQDKRRTPFNIGQAIELSGFTWEEAIGLAKGLPSGEETLREVLGWTGGQPFLTQRVCRLVREEMPPNPQFWGDMSVDEIVQSRIIRVWESQDEQVHFQTIGDRMMADEGLAGAMLGMYQRVLAEGGVGIDGSEEQIALRLTGVVKRGDRLCVMNRIYEWVFGSEWVSGKLEALRPYGEELKQWVETGKEEFLLRSNDLRKATVWADEKDRKLAPEDYRFLRASQDLETQIELQAAKERVALEQQAKNVLMIANRKAKRLVGVGSVFLGVSILGAGAGGLLLNIADIRIWSLTAKDSYANDERELALRISMNNYQRLQWMRGLVGLKLQSYQVTQESTMTALRSSIEDDIQNVGNFINPKLENIKDENSYSVISVVFSPDGQMIAFGSGDNTVKLWSRDGKLINTLKGHGESVNSVVFSPNGQTIASGSGDKTVKLWSRDGKLINTLKGHGESVNSVVFSPDGQTIASGSGDNTVKLWSRDGKLINTLKGHDESVNSVVFSPDGQTIASGSGDRNGQTIASGGRDNTVKLWSRDGKLINTLKGHDKAVNSVMFSPDGQTIASGSGDKTVKLWSRDGKLVNTFKGHGSSVFSIVFTPDGQTIASGSGDNTVKLWSRDGKLLNTLKGSNPPLMSMGFSPDGQTIAVGGGDNTMKLWSRDGKLLNTLKGHDDGVMSVVFSPDGETIASGSHDTTIRLWSRDGKLLNTLKGHDDGVMSVVFSPDGQTIISGSGDKTVKLWSRDGKLLNTLKGHGESVNSVVLSPDGQTIASGSGDQNVVFSPDGQKIASGSGDNTVKLWNRDGKLLNTLKGHDKSVNSVVFSPDGQMIASGSLDKTIKLWSRDGKLLNTLKGHDYGVKSLVFSPDGQTIASGSWDETIKLWSRDGKLLNTLKGHEFFVSSVMFSPDGQTIASGSGDGTVKLWSRDGKLLNTLKGHSDGVISLGFSPDGQTIAFGSLDKTVKLWNNWNWRDDDYFAMGCYWLSQHPNYAEFKNDCNQHRSRIPDLLINQAIATAATGNYAAAENHLNEAKQRNDRLDITPHLKTARTLASQSLLQQAQLRTTFKTLNDLSEDANVARSNFDSLTQSRLPEAAFLIDRAKTINLELNVEQEMKRVRDRWKVSVEELRSKK